MYNDYMYAVERNDEYLAHYGIKGMKWGVRKAVESGNSRKLDRAYRKASKKLAKLEKRASNGSKYAKRAAALGAGAAVAGGLAIAGTNKIANSITTGGIRGGKAINKGLVSGGKAVGAVGTVLGRSKNAKLRAFGQKTYQVGLGMAKVGKAGNVGKEVGTKGMVAGNAVRNWGNSNSIMRNVAGAYHKVGGSKLSGPIAKNYGKISNNTIARAGAAALGAGLAGAAGYNAYRAATTKRAAKKAAQWKSEMNKAFAGTKYANGNGNRQGKKRRR